MVADLGCLGCAFRSGKYSSPSTCDLVGQAACGAACYPSDRTPSHGQNTSCDSQQQEAGVTPEARRDRAAILRHDGVAPASDRVLAALCSLALSRAFAWSCCLLPLCRGEPGGETSSERHRPRTFPGSFHQSLRMTFEQGHLTVHGREDKSHRLGSAESLVLLADLVEAHIAGPPFLVEFLDFSGFNLLSEAEIVDQSTRTIRVPMALEETHEQLPSFVLVRVPCCDVVKIQLGKLAEERNVCVQVGLETVEAFEAGINEREGGHRGRRGIRQEEHGKLVDEIAVGEPLADGSGVTLGRQIFLIHAELLGEETYLLGLRFQEHVIEPA